MDNTLTPGLFDLACSPIVEATGMAKPTLYPYQDDAMNAVRHAIAEGHKRICLVSPTGSGKTVMGAYTIDSASDKGKRSAFLVDRLSLIDQTSRMYDRYGIEHLADVPMVCDTARDLQAAQAAGCEPHVVRTGRAALLSDSELAQWTAGIERVQVHASLAAMAEFLLHREHAALGIVGEDSRPGTLDT